MARKTKDMSPAGRKKGSGTLILRGSIWMAKWKVNGKTYTRTTKCTDRAEAEKKLEEFTKPFREKTELEIIENLQAKVRVQETKMKDAHNENEKPVELKYLIDVYKNDLNTSEISESSEGVYDGMISYFANHVKKQYAYEVERSDVMKFMVDLKKSHVESTYNGYLMILRRMFDVAMKHDYRIRTNPFDGLKTLRQPKNIGRNELTVEQVNKLIECASKRGEHVKMLFLMGVYTGMRKSDICTLKWNSIDFKNNLIRILPMKTRKNGVHAVIPIHEKVKEILQSVEKGESEYVFPRLEDMYKKHTLTYQITKTFKEAGIQTIVKIGDGKERVVSGFHALRVFFASNCAREGMPIKQVMTMLGHTKVDMSLHYTSAQETDLRLPDFEDSERRVTLKKEVYELLMKYCGSADINDFITGLLKNGSVPTTATMMKLKEDEELDELIEEVMQK